MARDRGDRAHIQVLEAVLIALIMFGAIGFVLTYSLPTSTTEPARSDLAARSKQALAVMNELPADDTRYGDNALSAAVAKALEGDPDELVTRLRGLLPPATRFNVYLHNGQHSILVYNSSTPRGETVSATHVLEPAWSHTFVDRDAGAYSPAPVPHTMGVYALPVYNSNTVDDGGVPVEITANLTRGGHRWSVRAVYSTIGGAQDANGDHVGSAVYGSDEHGVPKPVFERVDAHGIHTGESTVYVTVKATEEGIIPAGSELVIRVPQGQHAWYDVGGGKNSAWTKIDHHNETDRYKGGTMIVELAQDLSKGGVDQAIFEFTSYYDPVLATNQRRYDFYVLDVSLSGVRHGKSEVVLQDRRSETFTGGDYIEIYASVPKPMGWDDPTTWTVTLVNPAILTDPTSDAATTKLERVEIRQPDGIPLFAGVSSTPNYGATDWEKGADGTYLYWEPDDEMKLATSEAYAWTLTVTPNEQMTRNDARDYLVVPVTVGTGAGRYTQNLTHRVEPGLFFGQVPPREGAFHGYENAPANGYPVSAAPEYRALVLNGAWNYNTSVETTKDLFSTATVDAVPREVPVGGRAEVHVNAENLVTHLLQRGIDVETRTRIYPPWSMNGHYAVFDRTTVDGGAVGKDVTAVLATDLTNDGVLDIIMGTSGGRVIGFDVANDGALITGLTRDFPNQGVTDLADVRAPYLLGQPQTTRAAGVRATSADPAFLVGLSPNAASPNLPNLYALDDAFDDALPGEPFDDGAFAVSDVESGFDLDDDGYLDWGVGSDRGTTSAYDGDRTSSQNELPGSWPKVQNAREAHVEWGYTGPYAEPTYIGTIGLAWEVGLQRTVDEVDFTNPGAIDPVATVTQAAKSVYIETATDGLFGYHEDGSRLWSYAGGGFRTLSAVDLNGDETTDIVTGTASGYVFAINGTQPAMPWMGMTIASGSQILDADFHDASVGWVVDATGLSMATTDGFTTRNYTNVHEPPVPAYGVDLVDAALGFAVGPAGTMWKTTDGGGTAGLLEHDIRSVTSPLDSAKPLYGVANWYDVEFRDANRGIVVGSACSGTICGGRSVPLFTEDGGAVWFYSPTPGYVGVPATILNRVAWADTDRAFAVGDQGKIMRSDATATTRVGEVWVEKLPVGSTIEDSFHGVDCVTRDVCWVVGAMGKIYNTTNGGDTWTLREDVPVPKKAGGDPVTLRSVAFHDAEHGIIVGDDETVLLTKDGGVTWVLTPGAGTAVPNFNAAVYPDGDAAMFFGGNTTTRSYGVTMSYESRARAQTTRVVDLDALGYPADATVTHAQIQPYALNGATTGITYSVSADDGGSWKKMPIVNGQADVIGKAKFGNETLTTAGRHLKVRYDLSTDSSLTFQSPFVRGTNLTYVVKIPCPGLDVESCASTSPNFRPASKAKWCDTAALACYHLRNATVDIAGGSHKDAQETTAHWDRSGPGGKMEIRLPRVGKYWTTSVGGRVNDVDATRDVNGDGFRDVLVAVGPEQHPAGHVTSWSAGMKFVLIDGKTGGNITTVKPAAPPAQVRLRNPEVVIDLPQNAVAEPWRARFADLASGSFGFDGVPELVLAVCDHEKQSVNCTSRIMPTRIDGTTLDTIDLAGRVDVLFVKDVNLTDGHHDDFIVGTSSHTAVNSTGNAFSPGKVRIFSAQDARGLSEWTILAELASDQGGRLIVPWDVDDEAPFGPYVAEVQVRWSDEQGRLQSITLLDYFVVTPPSGKLPVRPIYTLQVVTWFEDWDYE